MTVCASPAIILKRLPYGDWDWILTLLTPNQGLVSAVAKSARRSRKRFAGILDLFALLTVVLRTSGKGLPVLTEAALQNPFPNIRADYLKTAHAAYWGELVLAWLREGPPQAPLFNLLRRTLTALDENEEAPEALGIFYQVKLLKYFGLSPNLMDCGRCRTPESEKAATCAPFDIAGGCILCPECLGTEASPHVTLSKGTLRQLRWTESAGFDQWRRIRYSSRMLAESGRFLERFITYHLAKTPRSLEVLRKIREDTPVGNAAAF